MEKIDSLSVWIPLLCTAVAWGVAALMVRHARKLHCLVTPNHRSSHVQPTPGSGGIGIAAAGLLAGMALMGSRGLDSWAVMALSLLIATIGLRDDVHFLSIKARLLAQLVCISGLVVILLPHMPLVLFETITLPYAVLLGASILAGMWWLNLFNFMDGIDGMAASQTIFMLAAAAGLGAWHQPDIINDATWVWAISIAAAAAGFLWLNWAPARIFMGDVGSLYLAFMLAALMIFSVREGWMSMEHWLILAAMFVTDASVTLLTRMLRGERWYEAHCSHTYQRLARHWGSHASATRLYLAINILWLTPLTVFAPDAWWVVAVAYAPLAVGAVWLGAGRPGNIQPMANAPMQTKSIQP